MRPIFPRPESAGAVLSTSTDHSLEGTSEGAVAGTVISPQPKNYWFSRNQTEDVKTPTHAPPEPPSLSLSSSDPDSLYYDLGDIDNNETAAQKSKRTGDLTINTNTGRAPVYDRDDEYIM